MSWDRDNCHETGTSVMGHQGHKTLTLSRLTSTHPLTHYRCGHGHTTRVTYTWTTTASFTPCLPEVTDTGLYPVLLSKNEGPGEKRTCDPVLCVSPGPSSDSMGLHVWGSDSEGSTEARHGLGGPGENSAWPECSL